MAEPEIGMALELHKISSNERKHHCQKPESAPTDIVTLRSETDLHPKVKSAEQYVEHLFRLSTHIIHYGNKISLFRHASEIGVKLVKLDTTSNCYFSKS